MRCTFRRLRVRLGGSFVMKWATLITKCCSTLFFKHLDTECCRKILFRYQNASLNISGNVLKNAKIREMNAQPNYLISNLLNKYEEYFKEMFWEIPKRLLRLPELKIAIFRAWNGIYVFWMNNLHSYHSKKIFFLHTRQ